MNSSFVVRLWAVAGAAFLSIGGANAQSNENGYGADPDGDTNPATMTRAVANIGATDVRLDPRFTIVTFEPPPGAHNKPIKDFLAPRYGVGFQKACAGRSATTSVIINMTAFAPISGRHPAPTPPIIATT